MHSDRTVARKIAFGGVFAALAVTLMTFGGMIPIATYVCPQLCALVLQFIFIFCGEKLSWAWYIAVGILSLLLSPDKEAAATFLFLGYYPILKPKFDGMPSPLFWKGLFFNVSVVIMYWLLLKLFGVAQMLEEFEEITLVMGIVLLLLGNTVFLLFDKILEKELFQKLVKYGK